MIIIDFTNIDVSQVNKAAVVYDYCLPVGFSVFSYGSWYTSKWSTILDQHIADGQTSDVDHYHTN